MSKEPIANASKAVFSEGNDGALNPSSQFPEQQNMHTRACKECSAPIGKREHYCEPCKIERRGFMKREWARVNLGRGTRPWGPRDNFKRDKDGKPIEKLCPTCQQWKPMDGFSARKDSACGVKAACKECELERSRRNEAKRKANAKPAMTSCRHCKAEFIKKKAKVFCSQQCRDDWNKELHEAKKIAENRFGSTGTCQCKKCKETRPISEFSMSGKTDFGCRPTVCASCKVDARKKNQRLYNRKRRKDPRHRMARNLRKRLVEILKSNSQTKTSRFSDLTGCTGAFLRAHIEAQFNNGMTWDNYGTAWHIDHIVPISTFDHAIKDDIKKCWHFSNLRPLLAEENIAKSNTIIDCQPELLLAM